VRLRIQSSRAQCGLAAALDVFRLLDRYSPDSLTRDMFNRAIVSYSRALEIGSKLLATTWDLVVVDEAHHLLLSETLYEIAHALSASARSVLLLSAIPAQRREDEFRRLLELLSMGIDELTIGLVPISDAAQEGTRLARLISQL